MFFDFFADNFCMNAPREKREKIIVSLDKGEISCTEAAKILKTARQNVWASLQNYRKKKKSFVHGNTGKKRPFAERRSKSVIYGEKIVKTWQLPEWQNTNYAFFTEILGDVYGIFLDHQTVAKVLKAHKCFSPVKRGERKKHAKSRKRRDLEGEMIQFDATPFDWLSDGRMLSLHGGIDDATGMIVGLYLCENECRLGYAQVLRQAFLNHGIFRESYTDFSSAFVDCSVGRTAKTSQEWIAEAKNAKTWHKEICEQLQIKRIFALSPQAKGRVERLWQTLQGRLQHIFLHKNIKTIDEANAALPTIIKNFNKHFKQRANKYGGAWQVADDKFKQNLDYFLSIKVEKKTDAHGKFIFHGENFILDAPRRACQTFTLCLSESFGLKALCADGKLYPVKFDGRYLEYARGDQMPQVERSLVEKYLLADTHSFIA